MTFRLREGADLGDAARKLEECSVLGMSVAGSSAGQQGFAHVAGYLAWTRATEAQLRNIFAETDIANHLRGTAYWAIRNPTYQDVRVIELVNSEATEQAGWLHDLAEQLVALQRRLSAAPGRMTVLDTNVLLHYRPPQQIDWPELMGVDEVRLVLPLRVIEEMDEKKYAVRRDNVPDRARRLLSQLWALLGPTAGGPVHLTPKVTIEVTIDDGPRHRPLDADQEILDTCELLRNVGRPVVLVTGDTSLSLRAASRRLPVFPMPESCLRNPPDPEPDH